MASPAPGRSESHGHFVQFYKADEPLLNRNVGRFLWDGLLRGDGLLVIATPERRESLSSHLRRLGGDVSILAGRKQLVFLDAKETLERFLVNGQPDWQRFEATISDALISLNVRADDGGVRAYGEMVGVLWQAGEYAAALAVEEYWNRLLHGSGITLFCGYPIDVFGKEFQAEELRAVRCAHTHLISGGAEDSLHAAVRQAMEDVLGSDAEQVRMQMTAGPSQREMSATAEDSILWLRENLPHAAEGILACARQYYEASQSLAA